MKSNYREVVFQDIITGKTFLTRSTAETEQTIAWEDGNVYPLVRIEISSDSHPAYTGRRKAMVSVGRVEAFRRRYSKV